MLLRFKPYEFQPAKCMLYTIFLLQCCMFALNLPGNVFSLLLKEICHTGEWVVSLAQTM